MGEDKTVDPISERLRQRHPQRIDLSLERMTALCAALGDPQLNLPPVVHVAGTNGKGSTIAFLRAMAEAAGLRVHVYSSPHLVRFNERVRLAGSLISDAALDAILDRIEAIPGEATVFESTTAAAFVAMSEVPADLALIEVGLGGSLDATNVLPVPQLAVITPVDHDHAEFLGTDLAKIAGEKAGILKRGGRAVVARQPEVARDVIGRVSARHGVALSVMGEDIDAFVEHGRLVFQGADRLLDLPLPNLSGPHQIDNAGLAVAAALDLGLTVDAIEAGLTSAVWPARMQRLKAGSYGTHAEAAGAELWLDGGHNPHAGRALSEALLERQRRDPRPMALIVGLLASKDAGGFFQTLRLLEAPVITVDFEGAAVPAEALAAVARGHGLGAMPADSVDEAVRRALDLGAGRIIICGSLYLAGEVLAASEDTWPV